MSAPVLALAVAAALGARGADDDARSAWPLEYRPETGAGVTPFRSLPQSYVERALKDDVDCGHQLPIDTSEGCPGMYEAIGEGLIICKLINAVVNDEKLHIARRALNKKKKLHPLQKAVRACPCAPPAARCPDVRWAGRRTTIWRSTPA